MTTQDLIDYILFLAGLGTGIDIITDSLRLKGLGDEAIASLCAQAKTQLVSP